MIAKIRSLRSNEGFMKYFRNTSWLFGEKIFRMLIGLFVGIWVARYLGPEQFGLFSYAQSFVGLFSAIATLGLDGIVVRELVNNESRRDELIGTAFWLKFVGGITVLFVLAIAVNFTSNDINTNILIFIIASATIFQSFNVIDFYYQSKVMGKYIVFANSISLLISSGVKVLLIINEAPLIAFAWTVLFDSIVLASGYAYFYLHNNLSIKSWKFNKYEAISLLKNSWPLILSGTVVVIYMRIDQVMIKEMIDSEAVGQFAAAVRISEAWYFIPMIVANSLFPAIINAKKQNEELYYARLQKLYDLMVWMAIGVAIPMTFLSNWIINLLYGTAYHDAGSILMITIWAGIGVNMSLVHGKWLLVEKYQKLGLFYTFLGVVLNIALNYFFIPIYGGIGAAFAILSTQVCLIPIQFFIKVARRNVIMMMLAILFPIRRLIQ